MKRFELDLAPNFPWVFGTDDMTLAMEENLENAIRANRDLEELQILYAPVCIFPQALPFLDEHWIGLFLTWAVRYGLHAQSRENLLDPARWKIVATRLRSGRFFRKDFFLEQLKEPLLLEIRETLTGLGVNGLDTTPSGETNVRIPGRYAFPDLQTLKNAYPKLRKLGVVRSDPLYKSHSFMDSSLLCYMSEYEMKNLDDTPLYAFDNSVSCIGKDLLDGKFLAPEAFIKKFWSKQNRQGRLTAIRMYPGLVKYMDRRDMMELLDVEGVLQYCIDKGWVTRVNYDEVYKALDNTCRPVLLKWGEENKIREKIEKFRQSVIEADPFSRLAMRQNWIVSDLKGVFIRLRPTVMSDTLWIPGKVDGKIVLGAILPDREPYEGESGISYHDIKKLMIDSEIDFHRFVYRFKSFLDVPFSPCLEVETYGNGKLGIAWDGTKYQAQKNGK